MHDQNFSESENKGKSRNATETGFLTFLPFLLFPHLSFSMPRFNELKFWQRSEESEPTDEPMMPSELNHTITTKHVQRVGQNNQK